MHSRCYMDSGGPLWQSRATKVDLKWEPSKNQWKRYSWRNTPAEKYPDGLYPNITECPSPEALSNDPHTCWKIPWWAVPEHYRVSLTWGFVKWSTHLLKDTLMGCTQTLGCPSPEALSNEPLPYVESNNWFNIFFINLSNISLQLNVFLIWLGNNGNVTMFSCKLYTIFWINLVEVIIICKKQKPPLSRKCRLEPFVSNVVICQGVMNIYRQTFHIAKFSCNIVLTLRIVPVPVSTIPCGSFAGGILNKWDIYF